MVPPLVTTPVVTKTRKPEFMGSVVEREQVCVLSPLRFLFNGSLLPLTAEALLKIPPRLATVIFK